MTPAEIAAENLEAAIGPMGWKEKDILPLRKGEFIILKDGRILIRSPIGSLNSLWSPCTDPADAHRLLMRMVELGWKYDITGPFPRGEHVASFYRGGSVEGPPAGGRKGKTPLLALTLAANVAFKALEGVKICLPYGNCSSARPCLRRV